MAENLVNRKGTWYARAAAPKPLRDLRRQLGRSGRADVWLSLRTKDKAVAKRLLSDALTQIDREFAAEAEQLLAAGAIQRSLTKPTEHELQDAAWHFLRRELVLDERVRAQQPSAEQRRRRVEQVREQLAKNPPSSDFDLLGRPGVLEVLAPEPFMGGDEHRSVLVKELREHLAANEFVLVDWAITEAALRNGWRVERDSTEYKTLGRYLLRNWLSALETAAKRDEGAYDAVTPSVTPLRSVDTETLREKEPLRPRKGESIADYFDAYLREAKGHRPSNALADARATLRHFVECNGNKPVRAYTRDDMANFKRLLLAAPARVEKLYPGVPLPKAVQRNRTDHHPVLSKASVRNKLSMLSAFGKWLEMNVEGVDAASFATTLPARTDSKKMDSFSADEVRIILNARAFTGCHSEQRQQEPGPHKIRDWRYWLVLLLAFTGARLNELMQLDVQDVEQLDGIWVLRIRADSAGKSLKTKGSKRIVPVHPRLIELGFLGFRDAAVRAGEKALFHDVTPDRHGRRSHYAGKWFRNFLRRVGVKGAEDLGGAHRWRHTLTDALRSAGVDDYDIASLLGHSVDAARMTGHYGRGLTMSVERSAELLAKADYPSVDFQLLA